MQLFWRALNGIHDALAGAPDAVRTGAMIAFVIGLLVAWALISSRIPKLGLALNVAIVALVVVEGLAVRSAPPASGDYAEGYQALGILSPSTALFWVGETITVIFGVVGSIIAITRMVEKPNPEAG